MKAYPAGKDWRLAEKSRAVNKYRARRGNYSRKS
jgi:hypothetical protein